MRRIALHKRRKLLRVVALRRRRLWLRLSRGVRRLPRRRLMYLGLAVLLVGSLILQLILTVKHVDATSLTWTNNSDFAYNRVGKCGATTVTNLAISGASYTDNSCASIGVDSSLTLQKDSTTNGYFLGSFTSVVAGNDQSYALKSDGTVWEWGYGGDGRLGNNAQQFQSAFQMHDATGVGYMSNVTALAASAGGSFCLALKSDGTVWSWGTNTNGQAGDNTVTTNKVMPVQVKDAPGTGFLTGITAIAASASNALALKNDGTVWGWGYNGYGQLGDNTTTQRPLPVQVKGVGGVGFLTGITAIAAGAYHSLAIKNDGTLWAWGRNSEGEIGDNTTTQRNTPVQVKDNPGTGFLTNVTSVTAGFYFSVAQRNDGSLWAWGQNTYGQLGDNTAIQRNTPTQVKDPTGASYLTGVVSYFAGNVHILALKGDGTVWSWGRNNEGQSGDGTVTQRSLPVQVRDFLGTGYLTGITKIGASNAHSLAYRSSDGTVWAWGRNANGQLGDTTTTQRNLPVQVRDVYYPTLSSITNVLTMSANGSHTLVLKTDGTVWTTGTNSDGRGGDNTTTNRLLPVEVRDPTGNTYLSGITAVAAGNGHSIALKNDGTVWSWGVNSSNQLGDNTATARYTAVQVKDPTGASFLTGITAIAVGGSHSLALKNDGTVWAWGLNSTNQLGDNTGVNRALPVQVKDPTGASFLTGITAISAFDAFSLALKNDGTVWGWGLNTNGQLGDNTIVNKSLPVQVKDTPGTGFLTSVSAISAGGTHSLALKTDGTVWGWGNNGNGQLGDNTTTQRNTPIQTKDVPGTGFLTGITSIATGYYHSVARKNDGTIYAWGRNSEGQLGDGTVTGRALPVQVKDGSGMAFQGSISSVKAGFYFTEALKSDGTILGWGQNSSGQLGDNTLITRILPVPMLDMGSTGFFNNVSSITSGDNTEYALKNDGTVWGWGVNSNGQIGDNTTTQRNFPTQVKDPTGLGYLTDITSISSGYGHTLALRSDGTVWAWGYNLYGELGDNSVVQRNLPVQVKDPTGNSFLTGITYIAAGGYHSFAIKNDGTVWAWGLNSSAELGDDTTTQRNLPVQVKGPNGVGYLSNITALAAGGAHSLALKSDGTVWAWGLGSSGQLGDNTASQRTAPIQVKDVPGTGFLTGITSIAAGYYHSIARKSDGTLYAWGRNAEGQIGDNTTTQRNLPVQVKDVPGTGFLTSMTQISTGYYHTVAMKSDGTVYSWGRNTEGEVADNTLTNRLLPVQAKDTTNTTTLSGISAITANGYQTIAQRTDNKLWTWGYNANARLGDAWVTNRPLPVLVLDTQMLYLPKYASSGSISGLVVDAGAGRKTKWSQITWNSAALPSNTSISFMARTSNDNATWSSWTAATSQTTVGSTTGTADLTVTPYSRYIELKASLSSSDRSSIPTLNDFSLSMNNDSTTPTTNASSIVMYRSNGGSAVTAGSWNNGPNPYFTWTAGADNAGGSGIAGYCLYLGQDNTANVATTKGLLGTSPFNTDGVCPFAVSTNSIDLAQSGLLGTPMSSSTQPYYLLAKAIDVAGNVYAGSAASFSFRYDNTPPANIAFMSGPSTFIATKDVTITWPTSGGQTASDSTSGLAGLQYRIGPTGTWYGTGHSGAQDITDVLPNSGSYQTDPTYDYPNLIEGNNIIYFRALDNAGNPSASYISAVIKINMSAPTQPQNLIVSPYTNTQNRFAFSWAEPATFAGSTSGITYCYTVNTLPTENTCNFTSPGQTGLAADAYATQPGDNTFYVVAKDEAGNINYATYASATFHANTPAPGVPLNLDVADISVKSTHNWKLALSWEAPTDIGSGVSSYRVYRSTVADSGFSQIASTSGMSYVDTNLSAITYYYKIKACDSANNCGAETSVVHMLPTGRFTSPAGLITNPSVEVSTRHATIRWATDRTSDSRVQIGTDSGGYRSTEAANSDQVMNHEIELNDLEAGTTYYYKAKWTDEDGNIGTTTEYAFTTLPPPTVKEVAVASVTLSTATIQFTSKDASKIKVYYGLTDGFGGTQIINTSLTESQYSVQLVGLDDGAKYYFKLNAFDSDGNEYDQTVLTFTTPPRPRITNLRFQPVDGEPTSTQKVTWTTNVPTTSNVTYGVENTSGSDIQVSKLVTDHEVVIKDLLDDSPYFLIAQSRDGDGNLATSDRQTFHTALDTRPPKISSITVEPSIRGAGAEARGQVVVSWHTDEPSTSQVAYGEGTDITNFNNRTSEDATLTTEHVVIVSDLPTSKVYSLRPMSRDKASNLGQGDAQPAIIGRASDSVLTIVLNTLRKVFGL